MATEVGKSSLSMVSRSSRNSSGVSRPVRPHSSNKMRVDSAVVLPIILALTDQSNTLPYLARIFSCTAV